MRSLLWDQGIREVEKERVGSGRREYERREVDGCASEGEKGLGSHEVE